MENIVAAGVAIIVIGNAVRMLWKEFGGYVRDVSPDNFTERTDEEWQ